MKRTLQMIKQAYRHDMKQPTYPDTKIEDTASESIHSVELKIEDTEGEPSQDENLVLLRKYLQPNSNMTLEFVSQTIDDRLPKKDPLSAEVWSFGETCIEVAEQIPYSHPSQLKLAGLLEHLASSSKFGQAHETKHISGQYVRYQRLGESLREALNGPLPETPRHYVNFNAFAANLFERRVVRTSPLYAIWAHRDAHEGREPSESNNGISEDIYVLAAAQWIFWYGQSLYKQLIFPGEVSTDELGMWAPGPLYDGKAHLTLHRWHFWRDGYNAVASSSKEDEKVYSQECKDVAAKAAAIMDALEKNMTF